MKTPRIRSAEPLDNHTLLVVFDNDEKRKYDVLPLLKNSVFEPLRSPAFFRSFSLEKGGYAIIWNKDIDISEYELWRHGEVIP